MARILRRWRERGHQINDRRVKSDLEPRPPRRLTPANFAMLVSPPELMRMRCMSLRERADDVLVRYRSRLSYSTLRRYYKQSGIRFKCVDLHAVKKHQDAVRIRAE